MTGTTEGDPLDYDQQPTPAEMQVALAELLAGLVVRTKIDGSGHDGEP